MLLRLRNSAAAAAVAEPEAAAAAAAALMLLLVKGVAAVQHADFLWVQQRLGYYLLRLSAETPEVREETNYLFLVSSSLKLMLHNAMHV